MHQTTRLGFSNDVHIFFKALKSTFGLKFYQKMYIQIDSNLDYMCKNIKFNFYFWNLLQFWV